MYYQESGFPKLPLRPIWARKGILSLNRPAKQASPNHSFSSLGRKSQCLARGLRSLSLQRCGPALRPRPGTEHDSAKLRVQPHPHAILQKHRPDPGHRGQE